MRLVLNMHFCTQENSFVDLVKLKHTISGFFVIAHEIIKGGVAVGVVSPPTSAAQF